MVIRSFFEDFYVFQKSKVKIINKEKIITQSLERLISRGLLIGYGRRTAFKWFITHLRLTKKGYKAVLYLLQKKQTKLPIK